MAFYQGIGTRADGPEMLTLRGIGFDYPKGTRQNWWQANAGVDSFSRLDETFSASVSPTAAPVQAWRRQTPELTLTYQGAAVLAKNLRSQNVRQFVMLSGLARQDPFLSCGFSGCSPVFYNQTRVVRKVCLVVSD